VTAEELARFASVLGEAERIRAQIAQDEATVPVAEGGKLAPLAAAPPAVVRPTAPAAAAAA
jgi:hypothetical protein